MLAYRLRTDAPQLRAIDVCAHIRAGLDVFTARTHPFTIEHIYAYTHITFMSYPRNNRVIYKLWFGPHVILCINKNDYEHTRKKGRHFTIHLCHYYDYSIYI